MSHLVEAKARALECAMAKANPEGRRWLRAGHVDSYEGESNRVEFWALEGSPPYGFIIFRVGDETAWRYADSGRLIGSCRAFEEERG